MGTHQEDLRPRPPALSATPGEDTGDLGGGKKGRVSGGLLKRREELGDMGGPPEGGGGEGVG